jgi:ketosteroid isomerase-like protein
MLEDRLALAAPRAYRVLVRSGFALLERLPATWRLRRAVVRREIRRGYDAFNRGDLAAMLAALHPEFVWDASRVEDWPEQPVYRGRLGFRGFYADWVAAFGAATFEIEEVRDLGDARALVLSEMRVTGRGSAVSVTVPWAQVFTIRSGLVARVENYSDRREALAAAGQAMTGGGRHLHR